MIIKIIFLKKIKNNKEIIIEVKKLTCMEFFTTSKKEYLFFLPIAKPTKPSVEKAYASKKKKPKLQTALVLYLLLNNLHLF